MAPVYHPREMALREPDKPALIMVDQGAMITYGELVRRADQAAALFASLGIGAGDTIAILIENHVGYPELIWGAKNSGIRYVTVSTHLNAADAAYVIGDSGAKLLVTSRKQATLAGEAVVLIASKPLLLMMDGIVARFQPYEALLERQPAVPPQGRKRGPSMLYSSGTTGRPKGVRTEFPDAPPEVPPQRLYMLLEQYAFDSDTVFVNPGPFYHAAPQRIMMTIHRTGGTVIGFQAFDPAATLDAIGRFGATHGFFVPTMFRRMLALPDDVRRAARTGTMRHAIHGALSDPAETSDDRLVGADDLGALRRYRSLWTYLHHFAGMAGASRLGRPARLQLHAADYRVRWQRSSRRRAGPDHDEERDECRLPRRCCQDGNAL